MTLPNSLLEPHLHNLLLQSFKEFFQLYQATDVAKIDSVNSLHAVVYIRHTTARIMKDMF